MEDVMAALGWAVVLPVCKHPINDLPSMLAPFVGGPLRHPGAGGAPPACVLIGAPVGGHAPTTPSYVHGRPSNCVALRSAGAPLLWVGVPSVACGAYCHTCPTAAAMDRAPDQGGGTLQVLSLGLDPQMHGAPQQGLPYIAVHAPSALTSELDPAPRTYLHEYFGVHATLHPIRAATAATEYFAAPYGTGNLVP